jgi:predicted ABC-type ATPase
MTHKPRLILVAGANGSGKSTLTKRWQTRIGKRLGLLLDPDAIARELNPQHPEHASIQAARTTLLRLETALEQRVDFIVETTLSDKHRHIQLLQTASQQGYRIWLWYVGLNSETLNALRVFERVSNGGHDVPIKDIVRRRERSLSNLKPTIALVDKAWIFDNSGRSMRIVARVENGVVQLERTKGWWTTYLEALGQT